MPAGGCAGAGVLQSEVRKVVQVVDTSRSSQGWPDGALSTLAMVQADIAAEARAATERWYRRRREEIEDAAAFASVLRGCNDGTVGLAAWSLWQEQAMGRLAEDVREQLEWGCLIMTCALPLLASGVREAPGGAVERPAEAA